MIFKYSKLLNISAQYLQNVQNYNAELATRDVATKKCIISKTCLEQLN